MSNYLITRCPEVRSVLAWAEKQTTELPLVKIQEAQMSRGFACRHDAAILAHHLWGFLNENLEDAAWEILDNCESQNGLEVWRRITEDFTKKTEAEQLNLEDAVVSPAAAAKPQDVAAALERWDTAYKAYVDAGGDVLSEKKKMGAILRLLPWVIKEKALWSYDEFKDSLDLRTWIRKKLRLLESWRRQGQEINATEPEGLSLEEAIDALGEDAGEEEILALIHGRRPQSRGRPGAGIPRGPPAPREQAPPRDPGDVRCGNCGGKGHSTKDCKKERLPIEKRKCFACGEEGHQSRFCPSKRRGGPGRNAPARVVEQDERAMCVADEFTPVPVHRALGLEAQPPPRAQG